MILASLFWVLILISLFVCTIWAAKIPLLALLIVALSPLFLLFFWKSTTLKSCQNVFSIVSALALGCLMVFSGSNLQNTLFWYGLDDGVLIFAGAFVLLALFLGWSISFFTKQHYRLFAIGAFLAIVQCCIPQNSLTLCLVCAALLVGAASCILASVIVLNKQMNEACQAVDKRNVGLFLLLRNLGFVAAAINVFLALTSKFCTQQGLHAATVSANVVAALLLFVLLFTYLRQPLDFVAKHQIQLLQKDCDVNKNRVKAQLADRLNYVQNYPIAMMLKKLLNVFVRCKTEGLEKVTENGACFVANHYEIFGPFVTVLKFPLTFRPWTDGLITDRSTLTRQLRSGVEISTRSWLIKPLRRALPKLIAAPLWKTVNCARPIAISRKGDEVKKMFSDSVDALTSGDNVMIYPEKTPEGEHYKIGGVDKFQTGFVELGQHYRAATGKELSFYPLYIDKKGKRMIVGDKVTFDSENELHAEKLRVANELYEKMLSLSEQCKNSHKVKNN